MPESDNSSSKESAGSAALQTLSDLLLKNEDFRKSFSRRTAYLALIVPILAIAELTVGLPFITPTSIPFISIGIIFLIGQIEDWLLSKHPQTVFYLCPEEGRFIPLKRTAPRIYRKLRACSHCGCALLKKCRQGKHPIVSPDQDNPDALPKAEDVCPFCDPALPKESRLYLPPPKSAAPTITAVKS